MELRCTGKAISLGLKGALTAEMKKGARWPGGGGANCAGSPWGIAMMGRTAKSGAVHPTVRIPSSASLRVTIRAAPSARAQSTFWCIIRGLEAHAVLLGNLQLPAAARLVARCLPPQPVSQLQLLALAQAPAGVGGALLTLSR